MGQDGRFATDLSIQVVSVETVVQEVVVKTVVQEVVVETVVRCIELRADESGPRAWVQPAARGREGRSVCQRAGAEREHFPKERPVGSAAWGGKRADMCRQLHIYQPLLTSVTHLAGGTTANNASSRRISHGPAATSDRQVPYCI